MQPAAVQSALHRAGSTRVVPVPEAEGSTGGAHPPAGQRAAASHTAALAGAYTGYRAIFERYGIIEGDDIEEIVDIASGFSHWSHLLPQILQ